MRVGSQPSAALMRVRRAWIGWGLADQVLHREAEISALPRKLWRGVPVFQIRCEGPVLHDLWVPEAVLWALISVHRFRCPFHR